MCKGCADRGKALIRTGRAMVRGDVKAVATETASVVKSGIHDIASALRTQTAAARHRLMMRR